MPHTPPCQFPIADIRQTRTLSLINRQFVWAVKRRDINTVARLFGEENGRRPDVTVLHRVRHVSDTVALTLLEDGERNDQMLSFLLSHGLTLASYPVCETDVVLWSNAAVATLIRRGLDITSACPHCHVAPISRHVLAVNAGFVLNAHRLGVRSEHTVEQLEKIQRADQATWARDYPSHLTSMLWDRWARYMAEKFEHRNRSQQLIIESLMALEAKKSRLRAGFIARILLRPESPFLALDVHGTLCHLFETCDWGSSPWQRIDRSLMVEILGDAWLYQREGWLSVKDKGIAAWSSGKRLQ